MVAASEHILQLLLNILGQWCRIWKMVINYDKTKIVYFRKKCVPRTQCNFFCNNTPVLIEEQYKYLGWVLGDAAGRAVGAIVNRCVRSDMYYTSSTFTKLYDSFVTPISDYCASIWGFKDYDKCNTIHHRALRSFLGVHKFTSNVVINGDMGWVLPSVRRKLDMLRLCKRIWNMDDNRLTKQIFNVDWFMNLRNWSWEVKDILPKCNFSYLKNQTHIGNEQFKQCIKFAQERLMEIK